VPRRRRSTVHGLLVVDKPRGPTSHTVVGWGRRVFGTRSVGHAGTLDPMATGVLLLGVGEGTKLLRWLTADAKAYSAELVLGRATATLDAEGEVTDERPVPALDEDALEGAMRRFRGPHVQVPPAFSAIRVDGERLHAKARRGEAVEVPPRDVVVHRLEGSLDGDRVRFEVEADKGFYVRSLGRDLAEALGTCGHLGALRRVASGAFVIDEAIDGAVLRAAAEGDGAAKAAVEEALLPLEAVARAMPAVRVDEVGSEDVAQGRPILPARIVESDAAAAAADAVAILGPGERLLAIGGPVGDGRYRVIRGLRR
jgi:tRNA pseudouridine55 synthase